MIRHVSHTLRERSHTQRSITYDHILHSQTKTSTCIRKSPSRSSRVQNLQRPATAGPMPVQDTTAAKTLSCPFYIGYEKRWTAPDVPVSRPVHNTTADSQLCPQRLHCVLCTALGRCHTVGRARAAAPGPPHVIRVHVRRIMGGRCSRRRTATISRLHDDA